MLHIICFALLLDLVPRTRAEVFSAIAEVEHLLETQKKIIDDLDFYIDKEERRLAIEERRLTVLKKRLDNYKKEHEKAMEDVPNYLGNPINAFTLIKRLMTDLDFVEDSIKIETDLKNVTKTHKDLKYPVLEDLTGAAQALTRLQETYNLHVKDLAEGKLNGDSCSTPMTASDCYELGRVLYDLKDYEKAIAWMKEALSKYQTEDMSYSFSEADILEYISFGYYLTGDMKEALEWTQKLLVVDPKHPRARGSVSYYQKVIAEEEARRSSGETGVDTPKEKKDEQLSEKTKKNRIYEALCRGEMDIASEVSKKLTCRYLTENHPFLKLAPIKMEMMYLDPDVVLFHEVLTEDEIAEIKVLAMPKFKRAFVNHMKTGKMITTDYRISKSAWLLDSVSPTIARISRRIADMTGLSMETAEELQVVNYGIGGHYAAHYDFARKSEPVFRDAAGNRIATVLFYMSDVKQGGATVFTELGLSLFPVRRSAAYWLNLHPSGEGNLATRHAACPVLRGSKWVANKWIHLGGQERLKPCNLEYQEEGIARMIPPPVLKTFT